MAPQRGRAFAGDRFLALVQMPAMMRQNAALPARTPAHATRWSRALASVSRVRSFRPDWPRRRWNLSARSFGDAVVVRGSLQRADDGVPIRPPRELREQFTDVDPGNRRRDRGIRAAGTRPEPLASCRRNRDGWGHPKARAEITDLARPSGEPSARPRRSLPE